MKTRESGTREKLTVLIPHDLGEYARTLNTLRMELCTNFGGYTESPFNGGWEAPDGAIIIEGGSRFEVSYEPGNGSRRLALALFSRAARECGQEWMHVERSAFEAEHLLVTAHVPTVPSEPVRGYNPDDLRGISTPHVRR